MSDLAVHCYCYRLFNFVTNYGNNVIMSHRCVQTFFFVQHALLSFDFCSSHPKTQDKVLFYSFVYLPMWFKKQVPVGIYNI